MHLVQDIAFEKILKFLDQIKGIHKQDTSRLRLFIEAIYYISRSGCQWRLLPYYYGKWRTVHKRFKDWSNRGIWQKIFEIGKIDPDMELTMIDSTIVRAHACAAGYEKDTHKQEALGRSRGGFTTKVHAIVDALGNPLKFILTAGQRNDITQAIPLSTEIESDLMSADKAYDCNEYVDFLKGNNCHPVIPSRSNRKIPREYDHHIYKERHLIECFFGKIKHFRRVFSRYDKTATSYLSFIYFVSTLIWLR